MTQYGEGPMKYYKLQIENKDESRWTTVLTTSMGIKAMQEDVDYWNSLGRKTRILKVEVTEVTER